MGFDPVRFVAEIDDEFICCICSMVLENPLQSPCEHVFCKKCIKEWLRVEEICPEDRISLHRDDLKPPARYFRNLLDKIEIRCDFEPKGCQSVTALEHLNAHVLNCMFNPNAEVVCNKGCNGKIKICEYDDHSCLTHLVTRLSRQEQEFIDLKITVTRQQQELAKLNDLKITVNRQQQKLAKLNDLKITVSRQNQKIAKLSDMMSVIRLQQEGNAKLKDKSSVSLDVPPECCWKKCLNMKISSELSNVLEQRDNDSFSYAQSSNYLRLGNSYFKIEVLEILDNSGIEIGLTSKQNREEFICYESSGGIYVNRIHQTYVKSFGKRDIIKCGIEFPDNFVNDGTKRVEVYFCKNQEFIFKILVKMPVDWLFPSVSMYEGDGTTDRNSVRYLRN